MHIVVLMLDMRAGEVTPVLAAIIVRSSQTAVRRIAGVQTAIRRISSEQKVRT